MAIPQEAPFAVDVENNSYWRPEPGGGDSRLGRFGRAGQSAFRESPHRLGVSGPSSGQGQAGKRIGELVTGKLDPKENPLRPTRFKEGLGKKGKTLMSH